MAAHTGNNEMIASRISSAARWTTRHKALWNEKRNVRVWEGEMGRATAGAGQTDSRHSETTAIDTVLLFKDVTRHGVIQLGGSVTSKSCLSQVHSTATTVGS